MNKIALALTTLLVLTSCTVERSMAGPADVGFMRISLPLMPADLRQVTATVTAPDMASPILQELVLSGNSDTTIGDIARVPAGNNRTVTINGYPATPENTTAVYRGSGTTDVEAGQAVQLSITVEPVVGDALVTATFPTGAPTIARVDHSVVIVTGARILSPPAYYLSLNESAGTATGTATAIPVGDERTFSVSVYDVWGTLLFTGDVTTAITEGMNTINVSLGD